MAWIKLDPDLACADLVPNQLICMPGSGWKNQTQHVETLFIDATELFTHLLSMWERWGRSHQDLVGMQTFFFSFSYNIVPITYSKIEKTTGHQLLTTCTRAQQHMLGGIFITNLGSINSSVWKAEKTRDRIAIIFWFKMHLPISWTWVLLQSGQ